MKQPKYEIRDCETLGTLFCDIYKDNVLFAREMDRQLAQSFINRPSYYPYALIDVPKMRTHLMEICHFNLNKCEFFEK